MTMQHLGPGEIFMTPLANDHYSVQYWNDGEWSMLVCHKDFLPGQLARIIEVIAPEMPDVYTVPQFVQISSSTGANGCICFVGLDGRGQVWVYNNSSFRWHKLPMLYNPKEDGNE